MGHRDSHGAGQTPTMGDGMLTPMNRSGKFDAFLREASRRPPCNALYSNAAPTRCNAAARGSTPASAGRFSRQLFAFRALASPVGSGSSSHAPRRSRARLEPPLVHAATLLLSASPAMGRPERAPTTHRRRRRRTALAAGSTARGEDKCPIFPRSCAPTRRARGGLCHRARLERSPSTRRDIHVDDGAPTPYAMT